MEHNRAPLNKRETQLNQFSKTRKIWTRIDLSVNFRCKAKWPILSLAFVRSNKHTFTIEPQAA